MSLTFKIEHLSNVEKTGKNLVACVRVVIKNNGKIVDIKRTKIDYNFPKMISAMLADGYIPEES